MAQLTRRKGGNDIFHPVCKVVSVINGVPLPAKAMPIFIGAILKELTNKENGQLVRSTIVDKSGKAVSLDDCIDLVEQWKRLAGRTFKVESIDKVPVVKRSRRTLQTYETTGTIPHLKEM